MTAGLLVNPGSARGSGPGLDLARRLQGRTGVEIRILDRFEALSDHLREMAAAGVSTLFISSGDGTVQAVQTLLGEDSPFPRPPRLALLPHGTTNMDAGDVGFRVPSLDRVAEIIASGDQLQRATHVKRRYTLRAVNPRGRPPQHGMFLGIGALAHAARQTQRDMNRRGIGGQIAPAMQLIRSVAKFLFVPPNPQDVDRIDRPYRIEVQGDGVGRAQGDMLLALVTTLDKLVLGSRPFWDHDSKPLRATTVAYPPPNLLRYLVPVMYGSHTGRTAPGCTSFGAKVVEARFEGPFLIDGEFFEAPEDDFLRIEAGIELEYLCG
jgi:diacylglycerol kinase (ATP)